MIEKMKKVVILASSSSRKKLLLSLRENGVMHITDMVHSSPSADKLESERSVYARVLQTLKERKDKNDKERITVSGEEFSVIHNSLLGAIEREAELKERLQSLQSEADMCRQEKELFDKEIMKK